MSTTEVLIINLIIMTGSALLASGAIYDETSLLVEKGFIGYVQDKVEKINTFFKRK